MQCNFLPRNKQLWELLWSNKLIVHYTDTDSPVGRSQQPRYIYVHSTHREKELDRREGKGRHWCLGDVYLNVALAARVIWRIFFDKTSLWDDGVSVWCELEDRPFFQSIQSAKCPFFSTHPLLQIILALHLLCGKELNNFFPLNSNDDFCLLF